ncbi:MAG: PGF-pre-PGF domain-containing protein [Candidatus Hadarchaeota archaeon]
MKCVSIVLLISAFVIFAFVSPVAAPPQQPPGPPPNACPICHENFSSFAEVTAHQYENHFSVYLNEHPGPVYSLIDGVEFSTISEVANYIRTTYASISPPLSKTYCPFCGVQVTSAATENDPYAMYVHWTTVHDWWPTAWEPPENWWPGGMRPPSDWTPPTTWDVPENLLTDIVPPYMPESSWKRPENWTPRSDWMPSERWMSSSSPSENMLSTSVSPRLNPEENHWVPPENKPCWTWERDNVTTDAPVGFDIPEGSTPFMRSADNGPWIPAERPAENVSVGGIKIDVSENVSDVVITALHLSPDDLPENVPPPAENFQELFQVGTNIPELIETAEIGIKVDQDWIAANNLDDNSITLQHCVNGVWTELPTTITGEDESYLYVSAETPSFSVFAVTGSQATSPATFPTTPTAGIPPLWVVGVSIIALVIAIVVVVSRHTLKVPRARP